MFQFRAYASSKGYPLRDGLPHSDTHGSRLLCSSPWLFAALHVLLRLCMPRHPPCALNHFNYKACTNRQDPKRSQPAAQTAVIRFNCGVKNPSQDPQLPLAHIPRTLAGAHYTLRIYISYYFIMSKNSPVELRGFEPRTPCLQSRCSSQLSYSPHSAPRLMWAWEDLNLRPHAYPACALTPCATSPGRAHTTRAHAPPA